MRTANLGIKMDRARAVLFLDVVTRTLERSWLALSLLFFAATCAAACATSGSDDRGDDDPTKWCCPKGTEDACQCPSGKDTCSGGKNMSNVRLEGPPESVRDGTRIRIAWDGGSGPGATLPPAYFERAQVDKTTANPDATLPVAEITRDGERQLAILLRDPLDRLKGRTTTFVLTFPDRAEFISCTHPGMKDVYLLTVSFAVNGEGAIENAKLEEGYNPGDI
jgi:hypothetical protein